MAFRDPKIQRQEWEAAQRLYAARWEAAQRLYAAGQAQPDQPTPPQVQNFDRSRQGHAVVKLSPAVPVTGNASPIGRANQARGEREQQARPVELLPIAAVPVSPEKIKADSLAAQFQRARQTEGPASFQPGTGSNTPGASPLVDASNQARAMGSRSGFVGAATDAEAARNLQSRLEQDQAAHAVALSMERGAEAQRDLRAAKLGISRGTLDQMEGRPDSPHIRSQAPEAPAPRSVWDRPGDSFGDAQRREGQYNNLLASANDPRLSNAERAARLSAAEGLRQSGEGNIERQKQEMAAWDGQRQAQIQASSALESQKLQEAGANYRNQASNQANVQTAQISQQGQNQRAAQSAYEERRKQDIDALKQGTDLYVSLFTPSKEKPYAEQDRASFQHFISQSGGPLKARGMKAEDLLRIQNGQPYANEMNLLYNVFQRYKQNQDHWWGNDTEVESWDRAWPRG